MRATQAKAIPRWDSLLARPEKTGFAARPERFEPWLGGDRQRDARMAKARIPSQDGWREVSLS